METSQVTTTLPTIWLSLSWLHFRSTLLIISTRYLRVQPRTVKTAFSRSVYARGSAYAITCPRVLSFVVLVTRHLISCGSNGSSSAATSWRTSSSVYSFPPAGCTAPGIKAGLVLTRLNLQEVHGSLYRPHDL